MPDGRGEMADGGPRSLADFLGRWLVRRRIAHANGSVAVFDGHAEWAPDGDAARYREIGTLQIDGHAPMQAEREYIWHEDLTVEFPDGRVFHKVPLAGGLVSHWCPPDQYDGKYDFSGWPKFRVSWNVRGPNKAYRMVTDYERQRDDARGA